VSSLDDPMFGVSTAPGAWGSNTVEGGYRLDLAQKYPWPGKLALRGASARAEAGAAGQEVEDTRLQLVESAMDSFYDYYLVGRALAVNDEGLRLLREFRQNAETRYRTGLVPQQDVLQADVEIGRQQERLLTLERMRQVAIARINTLMHLPPDAPLPPPPTEIKVEDGLPEARALRTAALAQRPDLLALSSRVAAERASLALAEKEYKPDVEVMAAYDAFWQERPLRTMLGVRLNLPVRLARRDAAVAEAQARLAQRQAEFARLTDQANFEVQQAFEQVRESERVVRLYEATILPAAEANVKAAQSAYVTGRIPFLSLIEAQRSLVGLRDRYYEAVADYFRRRAALERAVGTPLASPPLTPQAGAPGQSATPGAHDGPSR
jgi:outer membrane protein TolC